MISTFLRVLDLAPDFLTRAVKVHVKPESCLGHTLGSTREPALKLLSGQVGGRSAVLIATAVSLDGAALEGG